MTDALEKTVMIKGARLSFPHFFVKPVINGQEGKYGAKLILDPVEHKKVIAEINADIDAILKDRNKGKKIPGDKRCMRNGDDMGRDEYTDKMVVSVGSNSRPYTYQRDMSPASAEDELFYSGCYANVKISYWWQDNQYGKRVNANIIAAQFDKHGDPLGSGRPNEQQATEGFEALDEASEDDFDGEDEF